MRASYTFKIGGPAGFGIMTTGLMFSKIATRSGFQMYAYVEYPSLIRGGHNVMEVHFSKDDIHAQERKVDLLVALNKDTVELHKEELKDGAGVVYDPDLFDLTQGDVGDAVSLFPVPLKKIIEETGIKKVMENNITLGAAIGIFGLRIETLYSIIEDTFAKKGEEVIAENKKAADAGYKHVTDAGYKLKTAVQNPLEGSVEVVRDNMVITGNEGIGMGALIGNCQFYVAYPMTPSSSALHYMAAHGKKTGVVVRHAEDEIGVINEAIGASFAGARSMLGTSGGGFALMNEAVSLAGVTETGIVIFVAQRAGPATGMPTWQEQGELLFMIRSGHGEFPKIVLTPGDPIECIELSAKAQNLAAKYQTPIIIANDRYVAESHKSIPTQVMRDFAASFKVDHGKIDTQEGDGEVKAYPRYKAAEDGISSRVLPGTKGYYYQANSYEHAEDGHTTESVEERIKQVHKRAQKLTTYLNDEFELPKTYGAEDADIMLVGWGGTKAPVLDMLHQTGNTINGKSIGFVHFTHVWPMKADAVEDMLKGYKKLVLIENNSTAQFAQLIRQETGIVLREKLLKYDGRPFYPDEIITYLENIE